MRPDFLHKLGSDEFVSASDSGLQQALMLSSIILMYSSLDGAVNKMVAILLGVVPRKFLPAAKRRIVELKSVDCGEKIAEDQRQGVLKHVEKRKLDTRLDVIADAMSNTRMSLALSDKSIRSRISTLKLWRDEIVHRDRFTVDHDDVNRELRRAYMEFGDMCLLFDIALLEMVNNCQFD